jgi:hypothetical protein
MITRPTMSPPVNGSLDPLTSVAPPPLPAAPVGVAPLPLVASPDGRGAVVVSVLFAPVWPPCPPWLPLDGAAVVDVVEVDETGAAGEYAASGCEDMATTPNAVAAANRRVQIT